MAHLNDKASLNGVVKTEGFHLWPRAGSTSAQSISEQQVHWDYFQSLLSQVSIKVNVWVSLHRSLHSGSSLGGYLGVSLTSLRRVWNSGAALGDHTRALKRGKTKSPVSPSASHAQLSKQDFSSCVILFTCWLMESHLWDVVFRRKLWIIGS